MKKADDLGMELWEAQAAGLHSLVQKTPDHETLALLAESVTAIQGAIEALDEESQRASEFTKYRKHIPNALICTVIRPDLKIAERYVDSTMETPSRFVLRSLLYPSERILTIQRSLRIDIWIKQPRRSTCESLIRSFQAGELDCESFLAWFREQIMGLLGQQLDPYIVEVLLGMHVSGGEMLLPGDMQNFAGLDEENLIAVIVARARERRSRDQQGIRNLVKVLAPGQQKTRSASDAMKMIVNPMWADSDGHLQPYFETACKAPDVAYLSEIGELFASPEASSRTLAAAIIRAGSRELIERVGRTAGLTREESRFLHRRASGKVTKRDDEKLYRAVNAKMPAVKKALEDLVLGRFHKYI